MAHPKPDELRARPDIYVRKWRKRIHRETRKLGREVKRLHKFYNPVIKKIAKGQARNRRKQYVSTGEMFLDNVEKLMHKRIDGLYDYTSSEVKKMFDLMLPKRIKPVDGNIDKDFWGTTFKGMTANERLARLRNKTAKKMRAITARTFKEAEVWVEEEYAVDAWTTVEAYVVAQAENNLWLSQMMRYVDEFDYQNAEDEVISHYEHLSALDDLTCDECAGLDGQEIDTGRWSIGDGTFGDVDALMAVDIHPNCRCTAVPVTKTWKELGFNIDELPVGTRIARPHYPKTGPRGGRIWGRSTGPESVQGYVPADVRYKRWKGRA